MAFTHALATNNYGPCHLIVSSSAANGTHTTLAAAMADAVSGDTIFLRPGTYTENVTITPGVNITAFPCDAGLNLFSNTASNVIIKGKLSFSGAGATTISCVQLQTNSDNFLAVTGSSASIVNLDGCYLNCLNNSGISYTTSNASSAITISYCQGNIGTTGITPFVCTSTGTLYIQYTDIENSGNSVTASTTNATALNIERSLLKFAISMTASSGSFTYSNIACSNTTVLTTITSGTVQLNACLLDSGTASCISIGAGTTVAAYCCTVGSSNTNVVTGLGAFNYSNLTFQGTSSLINTTTQTPNYTNLGKYKASGQPAFLAREAASPTNVTGDGTSYTLLYDTEIFDQGGDFSSPTFTAPVTGRYQFSSGCDISGVLSTHTVGSFDLTTSNRNYTLINAPSKIFNVNTELSMTITSLCDMDVGDTATMVVTIFNGTKVVDIIGGTVSFFSGILVS